MIGDGSLGSQSRKTSHSSSRRHNNNDESSEEECIDVSSVEECRGQRSLEKSQSYSIKCGGKESRGHRS